MDDVPELQRVEAYDYVLPPDRIAQTPVEPRDSSRLLVLHRQTGAIEHAIFRDIGRFLQPGDLLVANESKVIPARLYGRKQGGNAAIEILLLAHRPEYGPTGWEALVRPGRRLKVGAAIDLDDGLTAEVMAISETGERMLLFRLHGEIAPGPVAEQLSRRGEMPLPPYIHTRLTDPDRYQTVYAREAGSAAAPTAGLHFTPRLIDELRGRGIDLAFVTLHVGLDTFKPVETDDLRQHHIHSETIIVTPETADRINTARAAGRRIMAVGTTTVRTLESVGRDGGPILPYTGRTELFITPGFPFRVTDALITNFHLPKSTLMALVSAFAGYETIMHAYEIAVAENYRFFSFGDAMLIL